MNIRDILSTLPHPIWFFGLIGNQTFKNDLDLVLIASKNRNDYNFKNFLYVLDDINKTLSDMIACRDEHFLFSPYFWDEPFLAECVKNNTTCKNESYKTIHLIAYIDYPAFISTESNPFVNEINNSSKNKNFVPIEKNSSFRMDKMISTTQTLSDQDWLWGRWSQSVVSLRLNNFKTELRLSASKQYSNYLIRHGFDLSQEEIMESFSVDHNNKK